MSQPDHAVYVRLLVKHQNELLRYIAPLAGSLDDAQDVLQETALALWNKFDQYDPGQPFLPWAKRFAKYEVLMHHRRRRRYTFLSEELLETLADRSTEQDAVREQRRHALADCVAKLPDADRVLLRQRYSQPGTTVQEVADATARTANAIYKTLQRIRRQLHRCVERTLASAEV